MAALIRPLAWELPYVAGAVLKRKKKKKGKKKNVKTMRFLKDYLFIYGHDHGIWKFLGWGLNPCHSNDNA